MIKTTISKYQFTDMIPVRIFHDSEMICIFYVTNDPIKIEKLDDYIYLKFDEDHRIYVDKYEIYTEDDFGNMQLTKSESIYA